MTRKKRGHRQQVYCHCGAGPFTARGREMHRRLRHSKASRAATALIVTLLVGCASPAIEPAATGLPITTSTTTSTLPAETQLSAAAVPTTMVPVAATTTTAPPSAVVVVAPQGAAWAQPLAACESTWDTDGVAPHRIDPTALSQDTNPKGLYRGAFQFSMASWRQAGGTGDPAAQPWDVQLAIAVRWHADTDPYEQWPTCWPKLYGYRSQTTEPTYEPDAPPVADVMVCDDPEVDCG